MKTIRLGPDEVFHRFLTLRWAFVLLSGPGSASDGGRVNRPRVEALYLSRAPQTALDEYRQGTSIAPPATLAAHEVTLDQVVDLSDGYPTIWSKDWAEWDCSWRKIARIDRTIPPSWLLSDDLVTQGHRGLLFPSLQHAGGTNRDDRQPLRATKNPGPAWLPSPGSRESALRTVPT